MKKGEEQKTPGAPPQAEPQGEKQGASGEGAKTALEALIRKRKLAETPDDDPPLPAPVPSS